MTLTTAITTRYSDLALEKKSVGLGRPRFTGGRAAIRAVFLRPKHDPSMGVPCGRLSSLPVPVTRSTNLHGIAHPLGRGEAIKQKSLLEAVMSKSISTSVVPFSFESSTVRTISENEQIFFHARDILAALGYAASTLEQVGSAIKAIPEEWRTHKPIMGKNVHFISEQGLYFFLGRSDKPKALPFQKWLAGEVLPAIRKTGYYSQRPEFDLLNQNVFQKGREAASDFFEKYRDAVSKGKSRPDVDVPEEVLIGILAMSIWKHDFLLSIDYDGRVCVRPRPSPYDGLAKAISDPSNIGLKDETIEEIAQACIAALAHRAKRRSEIVAKLRNN